MDDIEEYGYFVIDEPDDILVDSDTDIEHGTGYGIFVF